MNLRLTQAHRKNIRAPMRVLLPTKVLFSFQETLRHSQSLYRKKPLLRQRPLLRRKPLLRQRPLLRRKPLLRQRLLLLLRPLPSLMPCREKLLLTYRHRTPLRENRLYRPSHSLVHCSSSTQMQQILYTLIRRMDQK